jgi:hypothetical protein
MSTAKTPRALGPGVTNVTTRKSGKGRAPIGTRPGHSKGVDAQLETYKMAKKAYENEVKISSLPWAEVYFARLIPVTDISTILGNNVYKALYSQTISTSAEDIQVLEVIAGVDFDHACHNTPEGLHTEESSWMANERDRCSVGKFARFYAIINDSQLPEIGSSIQVEWTDFAPKTTGLIRDFSADSGIASSAQTPSAQGAFGGSPVRNVGNASESSLSPVDESEPLTKNFKYSDFRCKDGTPVPEKYKGRIKELALNLQVLRDTIDKPITIISGYRTKSYNDKLRIKEGEAPGRYTSQHIHARAADIVVPGMTSTEVLEKIKELIDTNAMDEGGVGVYSSFTHYDIRGVKARWDNREPAKGLVRKTSTEGKDPDTPQPLNN